MRFAVPRYIAACSRPNAIDQSLVILSRNWTGQSEHHASNCRSACHTAIAIICAIELSATPNGSTPLESWENTTGRGDCDCCHNWPVAQNVRPNAIFIKPFLVTVENENTTG